MGLIGKLPVEIVAVLATIFTLAAAIPAKAALLWDWKYTGHATEATGTFTTDDAPDKNGFYLITAITGSRNGQAITGLQPAGSAIPGNEPYAVDNLISASEPQLTEHGFGFSLANRDYANPFGKGNLYLEYLSAPPYRGGQGTEQPVVFTAKIIPATTK